MENKQWQNHGSAASREKAVVEEIPIHTQENRDSRAEKEKKERAFTAFRNKLSPVFHESTHEGQLFLKLPEKKM